MSFSAKIKTVDGEAVLTLPEDVLVRLGVAPGDTVSLEETAEGVLLRNVDARQMELAEEIMREHAETLKRLAQ